MSVQFPKTGWRPVSIGDLCEDKTGTVNPTKKPDVQFTYVDIASVDNQAKIIVTPQKLVGSDAPSRARRLIRHGDVLVSMTRPNLNAVAIVPKELDSEVCSTGFSVLRAGPLIVSEFLFHFVRSRTFVDHLSRLVSGALYPAVTEGQVRETIIPLPPMDEQRRIVDILNHAASIRRLRDEARAKTRDLIPALFVDMFGDPVTNPKGWPIVEMGELFATKPNYGTMIKPIAVSGGGTWLDIRVANIQDNQFRLDDKKFVVLPKKDVARYSVEDGDLLMARAIGSLDHLGKCVIAYPGVERWAFDSHLMRIRYNSGKVLPRFVQVLLGTAGGRALFLNKIRQSAVQFNINVGEFASIQIPVAPLPLQHEFVGRVAEVEAIAAMNDKAASIAEQLAQSLMAQVFGSVG